MSRSLLLTALLAIGACASPPAQVSQETLAAHRANVAKVIADIEMERR